MGETATLAEFVTATDYDDVPADAIDHAKTAIRDYLGVAIYGSSHDVGETIGSYVETALPGSDATVLGDGMASAPGAALANGTFGHAVDYDDTFESIVIHPTSPVFPAALAATELADATGRDTLTGYVVGVEVAFRVGHATYPSHYDNGWHSTGTIGAFGAAAAASSVLGLSAAVTRQAFGIVASGSSSLKKNFGTMTKPLHAGHAAQMGVRAAMLADAGFTADADVLEDVLGYGEVMTPGGEYDAAAITDDLGETWGVLDVGFKPYPSGVITHAAMDAMRSLVLDENLTPDDVASVTVTLDEAASEMLIHEDASDELEAKFSIEFCLAAILRERDAGVHEFTDEYVTAPETRDAMATVERDFEPNLFGDEFAGYGARVVVQTTDGEEYVAEERYAPGSPNNPVSEERLYGKFRECAEAVLPSEEVDDIEDAVATLEDEHSLEQLLAGARRAR